jgi:predicted dehydrogenase
MSGLPFHHLHSESLDLPSAEIVLLAIPNGVRDPYYLFLEEKNDIALYIEKPLAKSVKEHNRILGSRAPWQVAAGYDRRSFGITRLASDLFLHQPFGRAVSVKIEFGGLGRVLIGGTFMSDPALAGGGTLYQMGVHFLDAVVFASSATDVELRTGRLITANGMDVHVEGNLELRLSPTDILPLSILVTQLQAANNRIEIAFERATVRFSIMYGERSLRVTPNQADSSDWTLVPDVTTGPLDMFASFGLHWTNVIEAYRTRKPNYTSASQTLLTTKAMELLYSIPAEQITGC